jgi:hypothetical protein
MGVGHVIPGVELALGVAVGLGGPCGVRARLDRLLPQSQPREDVGRHVQGVRRGRRDLRVPPGGVERARGEWRVVVAVDEVVGDARMVRLLGEDPLQDLPRLQHVLYVLSVGS